MGLSHLLTQEEVCDYFDVSIYTVRNWIAKGDLTYVNLGTEKSRNLRFTEQAIQDFVQKRATRCDYISVANPLTGSGAGRRQGQEKSFEEAVVQLTGKKQNATS